MKNEQKRSLISIGFMIFIIGGFIIALYKYIPVLQNIQQDYKEIKKIDDLQSKILDKKRSKKDKKLKEKLNNLDNNQN